MSATGSDCGNWGRGRRRRKRTGWGGMGHWFDLTCLGVPSHIALQEEANLSSPTRNLTGPACRHPITARRPGRELTTPAQVPDTINYPYAPHPHPVRRQRHNKNDLSSARDMHSSPEVCRTLSSHREPPPPHKRVCQVASPARPSSSASYAPREPYTPLLQTQPQPHQVVRSGRFAVIEPCNPIGPETRPA